MSHRPRLHAAAGCLVRRVALTLALAHGAAACDRGATSTADAPIVSDSAGVRLVVNPGDTPEADGIRVPPRARFRTGWADDEPTFERIAGGRLRADGGAYVVDDAGTTLYVIDASGAVESKLGRRGEGPGEFESLEAIERLRGDSLLVYDYMSQRLTVFDPMGTYARSYRGPTGSGVDWSPAGVTRAGLLVWRPSAYAPSRLSGDGREWLDAGILVVLPHEAPADTLVVRPMVEVVFEAGRARSEPFARFSAAHGYLDGVAWARSDIAEVHWIGVDGRLAQVARWDAERVAVDDGVWAAYAESRRRRMSESAEANPEGVRRELADERRRASASLPYFRGLRATPEGEVWLSEYTFPGVDPTRYRVFSADGARLGWVTFPSPIELLDVSRSYALGIRRNEWGVEAVVVYELQRSTR